TPPQLEDLVHAFYLEHEWVRLDADSRNPKWFKILKESSDHWVVHQTMLDPEETAEWGMLLEVDLEASRQAGQVIMKLLSISNEVSTHFGS
ncbi:MAG: DUF3516 domain-containing protein, partial [Limisphaerales bacterium]